MPSQAFSRLMLKLGLVVASVPKSIKITPTSPSLPNLATTSTTMVALGASYGFTQDKNLLGEKVTTNELSLEPYVRYIGGTIGHKFSLFMDLTGDFGLIDKSGYAVSLRPGIAWAATEKFTAAFRFGFAGYDHGFYGVNNGFFLNCETVAPEIRFYYSF